MKNTTEEQYEQVMHRCKNLFEKKNHDYGMSWLRLRYSVSFTDQIFIKAKRIINVQETRVNKVNEPIEGEFIGIINYSIMALIKKNNPKLTEETEAEKVLELFEEEVLKIKELFEKKNHDYGEAWRDMRIRSIADLIMQKLLRVRMIERNDGKTTVSEPIEASFMDIVNYCIFALILKEEGADPMN